MKTLQIDEKFSIMYDDLNNNRPMYVLRHGDLHANIGVGTPNWIVAMFYALVNIQENEQAIVNANIEISSLELD